MQESSCRKVGERSLTLEHWCRRNEVRRLVRKGWGRRLEQYYWCRQVQLSLVKLNTFVWLNRNNKTTDLYTCLSGRAFLAQVTDIDYLLLLTSLIQGQTSVRVQKSKQALSHYYIHCYMGTPGSGSSRASRCFLTPTYTVTRVHQVLAEQASIYCKVIFGK